MLYWGGMSFWQQVDDPWTDPKTLDRRDQTAKGQLYNGEGSWCIPAAPSATTASLRACG